MRYCGRLKSGFPKDIHILSPGTVNVILYDTVLVGVIIIN